MTTESLLGLLVTVVAFALIASLFLALWFDRQ
jgi:hypothetical protein